MRTLELKERDVINTVDLEFRVITDIDQTQLPVIVDRSFSQPQGVVNLLKHHGYESKIFCEAPDRAETFTVKSDRWDWIVRPAKADDQIPSEYLNGLRILTNHNVKIDAVAIAKPQLREAIPDVISEECRRELHRVSKCLAFLLLALLATLRITAKGIIKTLEISRELGTRLIQGPDPVLLVRVKDNWIEIGRWE